MPTCPAGRPAVTLCVALCHAPRKLIYEMSIETDNVLSGVFDGAESDFDGVSIQFDACSLDMRNCEL